MTVFLKMNLLKNDVKASSNSLISKLSICVVVFNNSLWDFRVSGHPLAQNERSLHVFLQEPNIDHDKYVPGKVRNS